MIFALLERNKSARKVHWDTPPSHSAGLQKPLVFLTIKARQIMKLHTRVYWIVKRARLSSSRIIWLPPPPLPPSPASKLCLFLSLPVCRRLTITDERGRGRGSGRSQNHNAILCFILWQYLSKRLLVTYSKGTVSFLGCWMCCWNRSTVLATSAFSGPW